MTEETTRDKWLNAYNDMLVRVKTAIEEAEDYTVPLIRRAIHKARDTAVEVEELTRDEAEKVATYLQRDLHDAGEHLAETGHELGDWLRFDIKRIEDSLLDSLLAVADRTKLEMQEFEHDLEAGPPWNAGEVTGPGTLVCDSCDTTIRFHATGEIPECPNCGHTVYHRMTIQEAEK